MESEQEYNPVAIALVIRGLRGEEPLIPPWAEGLSLPIVDLLRCFLRQWSCIARLGLI
jgi:hypothetical protein